MGELYEQNVLQENKAGLELMKDRAEGYGREEISSESVEKHPAL